MAFTWGRVIDRFTLDFDGQTLDVVKYYPRLFENGFEVKGQYEDMPSFHNDVLHESFGSMFELVIAWITYKQLGMNNRNLAQGICRSLNLDHRNNQPTGE